ncbi:MAG: ABC transporter substrate-binding protein [Nocardioides sp.]|uniref:ABC transporter substrate-binding protein n=1 Tax=Nocardioides sp. TaxID=35761 RepID=UPI0039E6A705
MFQTPGQVDAEFARIVDELTRRGFLAGGLGSAAMLTLAACGSSTKQSDSGSSSGRFRYTDARGKTIDLAAIPNRIVMSEQAAAALIPYGIRPVGFWGSSTPATSPVLKGLDVSGIKSLGVTYGQVNIEALAALEPDLVITGWYAGDAFGGLGAESANISQKVAAVAPILAVSAQKPASTSLEDWRDLADKLGASVDTGTIATQRRTYQQAVADLKQAAAGRPHTTVYAISPENQFYVAIPKYFPELIDYKNWGVDILTSPAPQTATSAQFGELSYENVTRCKSDILLYDARSFAIPLAKAEQQYPTLKLLPAIAHNHIATWLTDSTYNYATYTPQIQALTTAIKKL